MVFFQNGISDAPCAWTLIIRREATEQDLEENNCLEMVGDTIWETRLEISHCPFCGEELAGHERKCEGRFAHLGSSGWTGKWQ